MINNSKGLLEKKRISYVYKRHGYILIWIFSFQDMIVCKSIWYHRVGGGCATLIRKSVQFKICKRGGTIECVILEMLSSEERIHLVNCYNPNKPLLLAEFKNILSKTGKSVVWMGDFNAHSPLWGIWKKDFNGLVLEEFMDLSNLINIT